VLRTWTAQKSRSAQLEAEMAGVGKMDLLELDDAATCLGKVIACLRHAARLFTSADGRARHRYDSIILSDDDAVFHPARLVLDIAEMSDPYMVFGQLSWVGHWDVQAHVHRGYANTREEVGDFLLRTIERNMTRQGPYTFPIGMWMGLGPGLVRHLVAALDAEPALLALQDALRTRPVRPKCSPQTDSGLGYILFVAARRSARVPLLRPLKFVDITSSGRLLFWFSGKSMPTVLPGPLALFHGAKVWDLHHRFFVCNIARLPGAVEMSRPLRCTSAYDHLNHSCYHHASKDRAVRDPAYATKCRGVLEDMWPEGTAWCMLRMKPQRMRCTYSRPSDAICNMSAEQVGCPVNAPRQKSLFGSRTGHRTRKPITAPR